MLVILFTSSCSIKKRVYMKGYYLASSVKKESFKPSENRTNGFACTSVIGTRSVLLVKPKRERVETSRTKLCPGDSCRDVIFFVSGAKARVKIVSDSAGLVKYVICDKKNGKIYTSQKRDIQKISSVVEPLPVETEQHQQSEEHGDDLNVFALLAFILAVMATLFFFVGLAVAFGIFSLLTIILTIIGLIQLSAHPKRYRSKWLIIFPSLFVIAFFALFISLLIYFG